MECQKLQQFKKTGMEGKMKELKRVEARQLLLGVTLIGIFASVPWLCGRNTAGSGFTGYALYAILLNFLTAGISCLVFTKIGKSEKTGIVCGALYTMSVFRTFKVVVEGAAGEGLVLLFLLLVLYGTYELTAGKDGAADKKERNREKWKALSALFVGVMGSLFGFFYPLYRESRQQGVSLRELTSPLIQSRGLYPAQLAVHFGRVDGLSARNAESMEHAYPVGVGFVLDAVLALFLILWFSGAFLKKKSRACMLAKVLAVLSILFMWMSLQCFPWDRLQTANGTLALLVGMIQFPERFLGLATLCLVYLCAFCLRYLEEEKGKAYPAALTAVFLCLLTSNLYFLDYAASLEILPWMGAAL